MTLIYADGFEDGTTGWALTSNTTGTGRFGTGMVGPGFAEYTLPATTAGPLIVGFAFKPTSTAVQLAMCTMLDNSQGSIHVVLVRGTSGELIVQRFTTVLATSAAGVIPLNTWCYVECKATISATTGSVTVKVNGVTIHALTNVNTKDSPSNVIAQFRLGGNVPGGAAGTAWDDVYIANNSGSFNNDFIGEVHVEHLHPATDDTAQWLGSDGNSTNNWDLVDESGAAVTTDYVASSTIGQRDLYTIVASAHGIATAVAAVIPVAVAAKSDTGTRLMKLDIKEGSGGTVRQSADLTLTTTYAPYQTVFDRKNDGTAWTVSDVNGLRIGQDVSG